MTMTGHEAKSVIKAYVKCRKLGGWRISGVPITESVEDLVTISEEGIKRRLFDESTDDETAGREIIPLKRQG